MDRSDRLLACDYQGMLAGLAALAMTPAASGESSSTLDPVCCLNCVLGHTHETNRCVTAPLFDPTTNPVVSLCAPPVLLQRGLYVDTLLPVAPFGLD